MKLIHIDFTQPSAHVRLARKFARLTGIELRRLLDVAHQPDRRAN